MFTGIIEALGEVMAIQPRQGDVRLIIDTGALDMRDVVLGDSISVSGVCLTAVELSETGFAADVSRESLALTTLGEMRPGTAVNLEKALRLADRLGGHMVSGHVDGVGKVVDISHEARSECWRFKAPRSLLGYIAKKGSITINGVSLTVNAVKGDEFAVNLVPHTLAHTTFHRLAVGSPVNLEVDVVARYLERLLEVKDGELDTDFLRTHGFA